MLLEKLLEAQRQPAAGTQPISPTDLNTLIQLLETPGASASTATASSLSDDRQDTTPTRVADSAVVAFVTGAPVTWNGSPRVLFVRNRPPRLRIHLTVAEPAPTAPLPKAIITVTVKGGTHQAVWLEKTFKQHNLNVNEVITLPFTADEWAHLPTNQVITAFAQVRWLAPTKGSQHQAVGSLEFVLVDTYFGRRNPTPRSTPGSSTPRRSTPSCFPPTTPPTGSWPPNSAVTHRTRRASPTSPRGG
jgi:hypothetical protein